MTNTEKLIQLVKENPDLPVVPMVDSEVVCDDCGYWMGSFGCCSVGEYVCYNDRFFDEREGFKESYYDYNDDELCEHFNYNPRICAYTVAQGQYTKEQLNENEENEKLLDQYLDSVADEYFKKAIIVYIGLPEEE